MRCWPCVLVIGLFTCSAISQVYSKDDGVTVSGTVLDIDGQPLGDATVAVVPVVDKRRGGGNPAMNATSDVKGKFVIRNVVPGRYILTSSHAGYVDGGYGTTKTGGGTATPITVVANRDLTSLFITMLPQATISGAVMDVNDAPAPRITVIVLRRDYLPDGGARYMVSGSVISDESGAFQMTDLPQGSYVVAIVPSPEKHISKSERGVPTATNELGDRPTITYYPNATDITLAIPIEVSAGRNTSGITIRMAERPVYHITGELLGVASPDITIHVVAMPMNFDIPAALAPTATVNRNGSFDLTGVSSGTYLLCATTSKGLTTIMDSMLLRVEEQDVHDVLFNIRRSVDITGTVRRDDRVKEPDKLLADEQARASLTQPTIKLTPIDEFVRESSRTTLTNDGTFSFSNVRPGKYRIEVGASATEYLASIEVGGKMLPEPIIEASETVGPIKITLAADGGAISGMVRNAKWELVPAATVILIKQESDMTAPCRSVRTDSDGSFSLTGLAPGKYQAQAWEEGDGRVECNQSLLKRYGDRGQSVTIKEHTTEAIVINQMVKGE